MPIVRGNTRLFSRPLKAYAFDPTQGKTLGNYMTINLDYEDLLPGPIGKHLMVIDYDASNKCYYAPVDLDNPVILLAGGLDPSETNPQFHQQMVFAVASETIRRFEFALGRRIKWRFQTGSPDDPYRKLLRIFPHAMQDANAFYSRDYLVHEEAREGPVTHAIVIGVGDYPHLNGGTGSLSLYHDGMKQLTSPPKSARTFAEWLVASYNHPARPLATVTLLISEQTKPQLFEHVRSHQRIPVQEATYDSVAEAIRDWKVRGEAHPDSLLIFYFCGHGSANGPDMTLLLSDYGGIPDAPLEGGLDFRRLRLGMSRRLPRQQVYFVDACRASSDTLIEAVGNAGRIPVHPGAERAAETPVFYATLAGEDAFGKPGEVSLFTGAVLNGLNGAGSDDSEGNWRVTTTRLKEAIDYYVRQAIASGAERASVPPTDELTTFDLHHLQGEPEVPVIVSCQPESENINAQLFCQGANVTHHRDASSEQWSLTLPAGDYRFRAEFSGDRRPKIEKQMWVRPVYRKVPLEVK